MDDRNLFQQLGQVSGGEAAQVFRDHLRGFVRQMICEVMAAEVEELCGPKHQPTGGKLFRAGSSLGRVLVDGEREEVVRPRVRERQGGSTSEVTLASYESASNPLSLDPKFYAVVEPELLRTAARAVGSGLFNPSPARGGGIEIFA